MSKKPWVRTSASQHEAFKRCQRYWFYGWVEKIERPVTPPQQRGTDIHAESEHYLKTGEVRDSSYTDKGLNYRPYVEALAPYLPEPSPDVLVEQRIDISTGLGVHWIGYIDIAWEEGAKVFIRDIKTTSNFRYAKTPAELMKNIQIVSYARWVFERLDYSGDIDVGLIYVKTEKSAVRKNPKTKLVQLGAKDGFDREHVEDVWLGEMDVVAQMKVAALAESAHDLPPTTSACGMFGGCPFSGRCGLAIGDLVAPPGRKKGNSMGNAFLKSLKDKQAKTSSNGVPTGTLPPDAPTRETPVAETKAEAGPPPAPEEPPKKKRGRPKKSSTAAKKKETGGFTLYVDCMPTKDACSGGIEPTLFEDWFGTLTQEMNEQVKEEKNLPSYLLLPYAEEKALVQLTIQSAIDRLPPAMVVTSGTPGAKDALGALVPHAVTVVRAMRG